MSSDWRKIFLRDLLEIRGGLSYKTSEIGSGNKKLLGMGCVSFDKRFLVSGCRQFCGEGKSHHIVTGGDLIIATRQQSDNLPILGFPAQIPKNLSSEKIYVGTNLYKVENHSEYSNSFLYWLMRGDIYRRHVRANASGSTVRMITKDVILNFEFNCPPVQESIKIAHFLDCLEDKIELIRKTNETLEGIAKSLFKSWFIDFDPVRAKSEGRSTGLPDEISELFPDSFEDSELGEIPSGWKSGKLGEHISIKRGGSPRPIKDYMVEDGLPWVKISDATASDNRFIPSTKAFIKPEGLSKTVFLKRGSLILSNSATPGIPKFLDLDACIHDGWLYFPEKDVFSDSYLYQLFLWIRPSLCLLGNGSVFTNLKTDILKQFEVLIPSDHSLQVFDQIVDCLHQRSLVLMKNSQTLCNLRDTLLPKLISGELRVPDAAKMIKEVGI